MISIRQELLPENHFSRQSVRLEKLPPELREVTVLYFFQDLKQTEIAAILGIGLPLVKYRLKRAKALLAGYLGKEEMP